MAENKISQEELAKVQEIVKALREAESGFYKVSVQREELKQASTQLFNQMTTMNQELQSQMATLKEAYGDIVVNLETGEYEAAPVQEETPSMEVVKE